jgi:diacylglycerol O-acyltransferase
MLYALGLRSATAAVRRVPQRNVNTVTTNVPGPPVPLYALGRELLEYLPFVPLSQGVRLGVAILSYNGGVRFGVTGDYDTMPEVEWFCQRIEAGVAELVARARDTADGATAPPRVS